MSTAEENQTLKLEPLPPDDNDRLLPTRIAQMDNHIEFLKQQIGALQSSLFEAERDKDEMLARAKECNISEDNDYRIVYVPKYEKKRVNVALLKEHYKDRYDLIVQNISARISDRAIAEAARADTFISQADVKSVIRDKAILAMVIPEATNIIGYDVSVVKK